MLISDVPFSAFTWDRQPEVVMKGETGHARSRTVVLGDYRARFVIFGASYRADHWCSKGHFVCVLQGEMTLSFDDGRRASIVAGDGFVISEGDGSHMVEAATGATAIILD
jgi:uncharacterized cupin superfamily protein